VDDIIYDRSWYEHYEDGSAIDEAKKYLEYGATTKLIKDLPHHGLSLDVGTATGRYVLMFDRMGYASHGVDISAEAVDFSKRCMVTNKKDESCIQLMDARSLRFPDSSFRVVTCMMGTLSHIPQPSKALAEFYRVLTPGGNLLISNWRSEISQDFLTVNTAEHNKYLYERSLGVECAIDLVTKAGFIPERGRHAILFSTEMIHLLINSSNGDPAGYLDKLEILETHIRRLFPEQKGQIYVLLARKPY
jgi:ubiquinone/menaquinone biosynthesis C-methylase UbiE